VKEIASGIRRDVEHADALILGGRRPLERGVDQLEAENRDGWNVIAILGGPCRAAKTQDDSNRHERQSQGAAAPSGEAIDAGTIAQSSEVKPSLAIDNARTMTAPVGCGADGSALWLCGTNRRSGVW
jgi:hypothetical protein